MRLKIKTMNLSRHSKIQLMVPVAWKVLKTFIYVSNLRKQVTLKEQIQMYTTNQLLTHPLVSPVLQPSLGGLPPLLILTGGGELLRDEQIYLAHKAANPSKYPLGDAYRSMYDSDNTILNKYKPTPVHLQVWEDLCHVAPTLSFTRPAKFMYRSIAQFGAWALARAQRRAIEIVDDDNISIISSQSGSDSEELESSTDSLTKHKLDLNTITGSVGRAGDAIPTFVNNMIRERVDRSGRIYRLAEASDLPALKLGSNQVGVIKPGPVQKWLQAKKTWDDRYSSTRRKVQKERIRALASGKIQPNEIGENPPPSALAARRTDRGPVSKKPRKSYGLAMWSGWGSKHDEATLKREEEAVEMDKKKQHNQSNLGRHKHPPPSAMGSLISVLSPTFHLPRQLGIKVLLANAVPVDGGGGPMKPDLKLVVDEQSQSQMRDRPRPWIYLLPIPNIVTADWGLLQQQSKSDSTESASDPSSIPLSNLTPDAPPDTIVESPETALLSAGFMPKFKTVSHLRDDSAGSGPASEVASIMTGRTGVMADDASTRAVFAVPGVISSRDQHLTDGTDDASIAPTTRPGSPLANEARSVFSDIDGLPSPTATSRPGNAGSDTPRSQRSLERLQSHQQDEGMGRMQPLRSPSAVAVVRMEGIASLVEDSPGRNNSGSSDHLDVDGDGVNLANGSEAQDIEHAQSTNSTKSDTSAIAATPTAAADRPKLYDRADTKFETAMEKL